ncbi:hypothetical protein Slin15195_G129490 [Septoria linicola]|uniref:Uncharacterized protein n=1 Tax=Septoria linicola TaxID=215465 RepID=A0A9Q9B2V5_9PEZI|nr:hypothetical protein Slin15195_G129490 [Septoria linicola]
MAVRTVTRRWGRAPPPTYTPPTPSPPPRELAEVDDDDDDDDNAQEAVYIAQLTKAADAKAFLAAYTGYSRLAGRRCGLVCLVLDSNQRIAPAVRDLVLHHAQREHTITSNATARIKALQRGQWQLSFAQLYILFAVEATKEHFLRGIVKAQNDGGPLVDFLTALDTVRSTRVVEQTDRIRQNRQEGSRSVSAWKPQDIENTRKLLRERRRIEDIGHYDDDHHIEQIQDEYNQNEHNQNEHSRDGTAVDDQIDDSAIEFEDLHVNPNASEGEGQAGKITTPSRQQQDHSEIDISLTSTSRSIQICRTFSPPAQRSARSRLSWEEPIAGVESIFSKSATPTDLWQSQPTKISSSSIHNNSDLGDAQLDLDSTITSSSCLSTLSCSTASQSRAHASRGHNRPIDTAKDPNDRLDRAFLALCLPVFFWPVAVWIASAPQRQPSPVRTQLHFSPHNELGDMSRHRLSDQQYDAALTSLHAHDRNLTKPAFTTLLRFFVSGQYHLIPETILDPGVDVPMPPYQLLHGAERLPDIVLPVGSNVEGQNYSLAILKPGHEGAVNCGYFVGPVNNLDIVRHFAASLQAPRGQFRIVQVDAEREEETRWDTILTRVLDLTANNCALREYDKNTVWDCIFLALATIHDQQHPSVHLTDLPEKPGVPAIDADDDVRAIYLNEATAFLDRCSQRTLTCRYFTDSARLALEHLSTQSCSPSNISREHMSFKGGLEMFVHDAEAMRAMVDKQYEACNRSRLIVRASMQPAL